MKNTIYDLQFFEKQISDICNQVMEILTNLPPDKLKQRFVVNKWSIAENLNHLNTTMQEYFIRLDNAKPSKIKIVSKDIPYEPGFFAKKFIKLLEPPPKPKLKTFNIFLPVSDIDIDDLSTKFFELRSELNKRVEEAISHKKLNFKIHSPASRFIRFEVGAAFLLLLAHDRRHLYSINGLLKKLN